MKIREIMQTDVHFLSPNASVQEAAQLMGDLGMRSLPVGTQGDLQGILTDGDLLIRLVARGRDPRATTVAEIMSRSVVVCSADDTADNVVDEMVSRNIRRMPVIDTNKQVVGMVGLDHLSRDTPHRLSRAGNRRERADKPVSASLLVVEDEEDIRELLTAMLADDGHQCAEAGTCAAARALIEAQRFDLVITDVKLPDGTGIDVARAAKQAGTGCLLVTGDANQMQRLQFRDEEYLAKPFRASELRERVRKLLPAARVANNEAVAVEQNRLRGSERRRKWFPFRIS
ncbi:MAG: CBS domain-containing protein [Alphaproteobacteria bacterium]|nr:CBS domain-containing protein [Alphaproteobacteria bacterium]